jgi:4-hydroxythreonine-4-phosphate dehydrogenase
VRPLVGISLGDPSGIGPEVTAAALAVPRVARALVPVVFGDAAQARLFRGYARVVAPLRHRPTAPSFVAVSALAAAARKVGRPSVAGGRAQLAYVDSAIAAAKGKQVDAICTAPVSKEQIVRGGASFVGHTERLAEAFGVEVMMLMDGPLLRVALATNHVALRDVSKRLRRPRLVRQLRLLSSSLAPSLKRLPRIAVCALNPHAGDGGVFGKEDSHIVAPAVLDASNSGVDCWGPFAADGLFASRARGFDVVLALYHDQGLIPVKTLDFARTVNVTLGLPVPRTSPDHGVAYDLAGRGRADFRPMMNALLHAARLARIPGKKRGP